jgi:hypothetical protein
MKNMPDIMLMGKNPNYLGSWDLYEIPGQEIVVTISKIKDEEVVNNGQKEGCTVMYFQENYKPMILNITNKKTLAKLYKSKLSENLVGKRVKIGFEKVKAFGKIHDALRIKNEIPKEITAPAPKCENCGKEIFAAYGMNPQQLSEYTLKTYGKKLCSDCATKLKKEQNSET